ncbi:hypothetical protein [Nocardiopsis sp. YSL2]|uniref:hypothetical protein n=1 Tax=Nocardiopsis sp. YSL2 TaxID=2939492 RepID=UPI0026F47345|nr:hypothetical protein [Nocardiopsis sp. YSL2]
MTTREQARAEAIELMARRISERDHAAWADRADPEPCAESLLAELAALGWRYVPSVRPVPPAAHRPGDGPATPAQARAYAARIRKQLTSEEDQTP